MMCKGFTAKDYYDVSVLINVGIKEGARIRGITQHQARVLLHKFWMAFLPEAFCLILKAFTQSRTHFWDLNKMLTQSRSVTEMWKYPRDFMLAYRTTKHARQLLDRVTAFDQGFA